MHEMHQKCFMFNVHGMHSIYVKREHICINNIKPYGVSAYSYGCREVNNDAKRARKV